MYPPKSPLENVWGNLMHMHGLGRFDGLNIWTSVDINIIAKSCTSWSMSRKLLYKLRKPHGTPTFKTEVLCLVSNVQLVKRLLLCNEHALLSFVRKTDP